MHKTQEYAPRDGDRAGDVIYDRLRSVNDAEVHLRRRIRAENNYDKLAHWQRSITCKVSALDDLPAGERANAPVIGSWEVRRHQLNHVLNVKLQDTTKTESNGRSLRIHLDTKRRVYTRPKGKKGQRVYVDPISVYQLPTKADIRSLKSAINSIRRYLHEWEARIPDMARQHFMMIAMLHLVGPESTGDDTPIYWVVPDMKSRNHVYDVDSNAFMLKDEATTLRRHHGKKIITALATGKELRFITVQQARQLTDHECIADLVIVDAMGVDATDIKTGFEEINKDREFMLQELETREY